MMRKNGFTLIELLAVIVILAIIAVIATPLTINVINSAKEKSFINSVYGLIDGVRLLSAEQLFEEQAIDVVVNFTDGTADNTNFKVSGDLPNLGTLHLNSEGKVELKVWSEELGKCAEKNSNEAEVKITDTVKELCVIDNVTVPIITLDGDSPMTIVEGETFVEPGFTATYRGVDITSSVQVSGTVNTSFIDTYKLTYTVNYNDKDAIPVERVVYVVSDVKTFREAMEPLLGTEVNNNDPDGNLRYVGSDPNNYVWFNKDYRGNSEKWRIIGIFHDETKGDQIKIIKDKYYRIGSIWNRYTSHSDLLSYWATASLQETLNETYLPSIEQNDPISYGYIDLEHIWNVGASEISYPITRNEFYILERGEIPVEAGAEVTWQGAIALMYPSDYGYSTSGDTTICDTVHVSMNKECYGNSWLSDEEYQQWTLTSKIKKSNWVDNRVFVISFENIMRDTNVYEGCYSDSVIGCLYDNAVRPALFLKSDTKIVGGQGTEEVPYELGV